MERETNREDWDSSKQAEIGGVLGWVLGGRGGWKPALKVPFVGLALFCHLQPVVCSIHLLERRRCNNTYTAAPKDGV